MVRAKMLANGEAVIISEGGVYKFNKAGDCISEGGAMTPDVTSNLLQLPVLSILSSGNNAEIALFIDDLTVKKYKATNGFLDALMKVQMARGYIRILSRKGQDDGIRFNQSIFVYPEGFNLLSVIGQVNCSEV